MFAKPRGNQFDFEKIECFEKHVVIAESKHTKRCTVKLKDFKLCNYKFLLYNCQTYLFLFLLTFF